MAWIADALLTLALAVLIVLVATIVFDVVHAVLHRLMRARSPWLRAIGELHGVHHRFLGRDVQVDGALIGANLRHHVIPEYATHLLVTSSLLLVLPPAPVVGALAVETLVVVVILRDRGLDVNHRPRARIPAYLPSFVCVPAYHALHHVWPEAFYSSWIKALDWALGSAAQVRGRRVGVTGAETILGRALASTLETETGVPPVHLPRPVLAEGIARELADVDLLVLDLPPETGADACVAVIEAAIRATADRLVPLEVWAIVDSPSTFAGEGRGYAVDARVIYRHVVVPRGLDARAALSAADTILGRVRRGAHWIDLAPPAQRLRDFLGGWRAARPVLHGPRASALA